MKTYLLRTVQADKLLNICRTLSNHFLLINFMPVAHVELSFKLELLFTVCLPISPYSLVTVGFCRFSLVSVTSINV